MPRVNAPEDDPLFDPEDDRADYGEPDGSWTEADEVAFSAWSAIWPESIDS